MLVVVNMHGHRGCSRPAETTSQSTQALSAKPTTVLA